MITLTLDFNVPYRGDNTLLNAILRDWCNASTDYTNAEVVELIAKKYNIDATWDNSCETLTICISEKQLFLFEFTYK